MGFSITSNIQGNAMNAEHSTCLICNSQFKIKKSKANKYCGMDCYRTARKRGDYVQAIAKPTGSCSNCGMDVYGSFSKRRNGEKSENIYCNRSCYNSHRAKIKETPKSLCLNCNGPILLNATASTTPKYCCWNCRNEHKKSKDRHCVHCGVWFSALKIFKDRNKKLVADNSRKTCSTECYINNIKNNQDRKDKISTAFTGDKHPNWQGGTALMSMGFRGYEWKNIRLEAIKRDKFKCVHCGMNRDDHYEKYNCDFNINHIKPFYQFGGNTELANKMSNLETLCKSCHTKADWKYRKENQIQLGLGF